MSDGSKKDDAKTAKEKDLTGILELASHLPPQSAGELLSTDPFSVNEVQKVEQIDEFESIDQIGMIDHSSSPAEIPFGSPIPSPQEPRPAAADSDFFQEDFPVSEPETTNTEAKIDFREISAVEQTLVPERNFEAKESDMQSLPLDPVTPMEGIKNYSERARETLFQTNSANPFHLWISGNFDPFSRDKLLLFITENPMGLNSMDLDRQIHAGRVMLPRISEFSGIKLIQDLRDSGLQFRLRPSDRDADEILPEAENLRVHYDADTTGRSGASLTLLPEGPVDEKLWQAFDSIQMVQFLKAEIIEVERSELFQELLERMTLSLKNKAALKGASAISGLQHELKPLRLPSHYQLELKANLFKKL